jgi:hypothetical protein
MTGVTGDDVLAISLILGVFAVFWAVGKRIRE